LKKKEKEEKEKAEREQLENDIGGGEFGLQSEVAANDKDEDSGKPPNKAQKKKKEKEAKDKAEREAKEKLVREMEETEEIHDDPMGGAGWNPEAEEWNMVDNEDANPASKKDEKQDGDGKEDMEEKKDEAKKDEEETQDWGLPVKKGKKKKGKK